MLQEWIHINHIICDRLKNSIEKLKGRILESITPEEYHLVGKIHENSYKKTFEVIKKRHILKFNELISKNKVTKSSAINITDKTKWIINMSSRQLTHYKTNLLTKGLNFSITSKTLPNKDYYSYYRRCSKGSWIRKGWHDSCQSKPYPSKLQTS